MDKCLICKKEIVLEKHHIISQCYNGSNKEYNIAQICANCHKYVHYGIIIIEGWYTGFDGRSLVWRKLNEKSITDIEDPKVWLYQNHKIIQEKYNRRK